MRLAVQQNASYQYRREQEGYAVAGERHPLV